MYSEIENLAKLIVEHSVGIKKGEKVLVEGDPTGTSLLHLHLHKEILKKGGIPIHKLMLGDCDYLNLVYGDEEQFRSMAEDDRKTMENMDALISIQSSVNPRRADAMDQEKIAAYNRATRVVRETVIKKLKEGKFRLFFVAYPISGIAQEHGMSLVEYEDRFCRACFLDKKDPIEEWRKLSEKHERFKRFLEKKRTMHLIGENMDLTFSIRAEDGKEWICDNGKKYLPDGEIYTDHPIKESANGYIAFTYPGIFERKEIKDIRMEFKDGKITTAGSSNEERLLQGMLKCDGGEAYLSAFGIGTNYNIDKFVGQMAFDEKMGGTMHLAFRGSSMWSMWVLLRHMGENDKMYADEELFYAQGHFLI